MSLFVTGTDTGIGKTVVCAALLWRYGRDLPLAYWKPVGTGGPEESDVRTVRYLAGGQARVFEEGYLFSEPVSPHLAARIDGQSISLGLLDRRFEELSSTGSALVVEGAGGLLVPLDEEGTLIVELPQRWSLPVLVTARSTLGTINHTLLTLEALRHRRLEVAGVVLVGPPDPENRKAIEALGRVEVLGELAWLDPLAPATLGEAALRLDPAGRLRPRLLPRETEERR